MDLPIIVQIFYLLDFLFYVIVSSLRLYLLNFYQYSELYKCMKASIFNDSHY